MSDNLVAKWWNEAWADGLWAAAWEKSVAGLTPEQAVWQPAPGRHSIWQIVEHMSFWREHVLRKHADQPGFDDATIAKRNFPQPAAPSADEWEAVCDRFRDTHQRMADALTSAADLSTLAYLLPHDAYHIGQVNYLRALQGLPPVV